MLVSIRSKFARPIRNPEMSNASATHGSLHSSKSKVAGTFKVRKDEVDDGVLFILGEIGSYKERVFAFDLYSFFNQHTSPLIYLVNIQSSIRH